MAFPPLYLGFRENQGADESLGQIPSKTTGHELGTRVRSAGGWYVNPILSRLYAGSLTLSPGSGIGSLTDLMERYGPRTIFPSLEFPSSHSTALLKAAYVFSFLS